MFPRTLVFCAVLVAALPLQAQAAFDSAQAAREKELTILRVTPDGNDVYAGKQIVIQFNRPVVPIGRMERSASELPITLTPELNCEWRWINTSALSCNLPDNAPLQESTRYAIDIKPGITAEDGATLADTYHHSFITTRADISYPGFKQWRSPGMPQLRLVLNQAVSKETAEEHIYMLVGDGTTERVKVKLFADPDDRELPEVIPAPGEKYALRFAGQPKQKSDDQLHWMGGREARRVWLAEPVRELPLDTHVVVKLEPGLASAMGPELSAASRDIVAFDTLPEFAFLGMTCRNNEGREVTVTPAEAQGSKCDPMEGVRFNFNSPVESNQLGRMLKFSPAIAGWSAYDTDEGYGPDGENYYSYRLQEPHKKGKTYSVWLPGGLKAAQEYQAVSRAQTMSWWERAWHWVKSLFSKIKPIDVEDVFGRELSSPLNISFATDHRRPNFEIAHRDAVIEKGVDSEVPLYVTNLDKLTFNYRSVTGKSAKSDQVFTKTPDKVADLQYALPFGVRAMLDGGTGAVYGHLETEPLVKGKSRESRRMFAQVTPYQVHVKLGHFNTVAWVTDMATGNAVEGAKVTIYKDSFVTLGAPKDIVAQGSTDAAGLAMLPGTEKLDPSLTVAPSYGQYGDHELRFFVRVQKGDDVALLPVSSDYVINSYRSSGSDSVWPAAKLRYGHMRSWGTTAQGIYRAGDVIQYKVYVRNQDNDRFVPAPGKGYTLKIIDPTGKAVETVENVTLNPFGGFSGEFKVAKEAAVGWYQFKLIADFADKGPNDYDEAYESDEGGEADSEEAEAQKKKRSWVPMRVLVSDFTPSPFRVTNQINGDLFHAEQDVEVTTRAELHSGGPYTDAQARVTAILDSMPFISKHPLTKDFQFDSYENETNSQQIFQDTQPIDNKGERALKFPMGKPGIIYGKLTVESAVQDDRGKFVAGIGTADYVGVDRLVGLHATDWMYNAGKPARLQYVVVDSRGAPVTGTEVEIAIEREETKAARVKGAGNAYLMEYHNEWVASGNCKGTPEASVAECEFTPKQAGYYRATARIKDTEGREHSTKMYLYVVGKDYVLWNDENDNGLTIVPEKTSYKIGDTARYMIKNPYPGAKALITVERYGVIDSFTRTLEGSTPVIEFPVKPDYMPGFYLSVMVTSPRVDKPIDENQVDLGKPAFRMGYVNVPVTDPYKEMNVTVKPAQDVYKPRDKVSVTIHAEPRHADKKEPIEIAVAVLDESVFDLVAGGKSYYDPYGGFYKLDSLDLRNYNLLTRLVGRQKFEKKGANPGGDGGADLSMRTLFKFVSYWNPSLKPDKDGNVTITFEAPDNLTGWRVLAMAVTPSDRFGLGDGNFKVNRPTEVRPVMPNQVLEGDSFNAGFSVMNRTDKPRELDVTIHAEGNLDDTRSKPDYTTKVKLEPYKRTTVTMPVKVSAVAQRSDVPEGELRFTVTAGDDIDKDGMTHSLVVHKRRSLEVAANYGTTTESHVEEPIQFPKEMMPDVGAVSVVASPTVIGNVSGAFSYLRDYPYTCWEQRLTKGVMAAHYKELKAYMPDFFHWKDAESLPQQTLDMAASFQTPSGGMAYFIAEDRYADPYLSAYTALAFNWLRADGYKIPEEVETKLQAYLDNLLKNDAVPDFYSDGMKSTVRAVALAALAERGKAGKADLDRYRPHVPEMSLFGKAHYLRAAQSVKDADALAAETAKMILGQSNETGGKFMFNETLDDSYSRILATPLRENCAALAAFTSFGEQDVGAKLVGDIPFKLVRTITQTRKNRDHWENTQENMFCMSALIEFARVYEKDKPSMKVTAALDGQNFGEAEFKDVRDPAKVMERPVQMGDAGRKMNVAIDKDGSGRLYYATRLAYALPPELAKPANAGIEIHREYNVERDGKWEMLKDGDSIKRGEVVRVDLFVSLPAARNFVVVDDPVPGGLEPVNRDLAAASVVDAKKGEYEAAGGSWYFKFSDWQGYNVSRWSFYHQELRHDAVRYYADYLPPGNYRLSYTAQAIATGDFSVLPSMASEMYDPDVYGKTEALTLKVQEK